MFSIDTPFFVPYKIMELHMLESCVCGFHAYQDNYSPTTGQQIPYQTEHSNAFDPYTVVIRKSENVIRHVPWKIWFLLHTLFLYSEQAL